MSNTFFQGGAKNFLGVASPPRTPLVTGLVDRYYYVTYINVGNVRWYRSPLWNQEMQALNNFWLCKKRTTNPWSYSVNSTVEKKLLTKR